MASAITEHRVTQESVFCYRIPTEEPESDGTLKWDHTDLILVQLHSGDTQGMGYTYANPATAKMIKEILFQEVHNEDPMDISRLWYKMLSKIRNLGQPGVASMAVAALDNALWDLKAKLINLPLCKLLGQVRPSVPVYASGGFTSYTAKKLQEKFEEGVNEGYEMFKMKIGRDYPQDLKRLEAARATIDNKMLFVDANGAYFPKEAVAMTEILEGFEVKWFEEPVTSDHLIGLHFVRTHGSPKMNISAGEYGYNQTYFNQMLAAQAVDVLQADATRCAGITGFIKAHDLCEAHHLPFSAHCAPSLHLHPSLCLKNLQHIENFRDHVRIEHMLFNGCKKAENGYMEPDLSLAGFGLEFKFQDAQKFQIH